MFNKSTFWKQSSSLLLTLGLLSGCGGGSSSTTTVTTPQNQAPTVSITSPTQIDELTPYTLSATANDSDGSITSTAWSQTSGQVVELVDANSASATFTAPDVDEDEILSFSVTVTDNQGATATDTIDVTIKHINELPVVDAGEDLVVDELSTVSLQGSASDADGTIAAIAWSQTEGQTVDIVNGDSLNATFVAPDVSEDVDLSFMLTVTDNHGASVTDAVKVTVKYINQLPVVNVGDDQMVDEQTMVSLQGSATDIDGSITALQWTQTAGQTVDINNADSLSASFMAPDVNDDAVLSFMLTATDDKGATTSDTIDISVTHINQLPLVNAGASQVVDEQTTVSLQGSATDAEGDVTSYEWTQISGPAVTFDNTQQALTSFVAPVVLVADSPATLEFNLTVTDRHGGVASSQTTVTVNAVNALPVILAGEAISVVETETVNWQAEVSDADGEVSSYLWAQSADDVVRVELIEPEGSALQFVAPEVDQNTELTFTLTVADNEGGLSSLIKTVSVIDTVEIALDKFGTGNVTVNDELWQCDSSNCSKRFAKGTELVFAAEDAGDWRFAHFNGCDSKAENSCTINGESDSTVYVAFENTANASIGTDVHLLTSDELAQLTSIEDGALIFSRDASTISALPVGTVVVSLTGDGFARRVTNIIALTNSSIILETTEASVQEVIQSGALVSSLVLEYEDITEMSLADGVQLLHPQSLEAKTNCSGSLCFSIATSFSDNVSISGSIGVNLTPDIGLDISDSRLNSLRLVMHSRVDSTLQLSVAAEDSFSASRPLPLGTIRFSPIIIGWVVIVPTIDFTVGVSGSVEGNISFGTSPSFNGTIGARYSRNSGWNKVSSSRYSSGSGVTPTIGASFSAEAYTDVASTFAFYGVLGPYIKTGPYIKGSAEVVVDLDNGQTCTDYGLYAGFRSRFGGKVKILSYELANYNVTLFNKSKKFLGSRDEECEPDTEAPTVPQNVAVDFYDATTANVSWSASEDNYTVEKYIVYRNSNIIDEVEVTSFADSNLMPETQYCYSVRAVDTSGNQSDLSSEACITTAAEEDVTPPTVPSITAVTALSTRSLSVSWSTATDDNGVYGYILRRSDGVVTSHAGSFTDVLSLQPDTEYCFTVAAFDTSGNTSAYSDSVCGSTLPGDSARWLMRIKCDTQSEYVVGQNIDLESDVSQSVRVTGSGNDYNGTPLAYVLSGTYQGQSQNLNGSITWTFEGSSSVRKDEFSVDLSGDDTGDVAMTQVQVTGCDADIRFTRNSERFVQPSFDVDSSVLLNEQ